MPLPVGFELEEEVQAPEGFEIEQPSKVPNGFTLETKREGDFLPSSIPTYMRFKFYQDRAHSERANWLNEAFEGRMNIQEAITKGNSERDYWMAQAGPYEDLTIKDFAKQPLKLAAGSVAQFVPYMVSSATEGFKYGTIVGGGFATIAALAGQIPPATFFPEEMFTVPAAFAVGMKMGWTFGVFKNMLKREGASFFGDMIEKGISPGTSRVLGLGVGTLNALLELAQFRAITAPFRQVYAKVIKTAIGKSAIIQAIGRYAKNTGIQVAQEDLQEVVPLIAETIAGVVEENPNAIPTKEEWIIRLLETTVQAAAGLALIGIPGAAVDVKTSLRAEKIVKKTEDIALLDKIITELKGEEKPAEALKVPVLPTPEAQGEVISPETALTQEALKYKSAEEFVKAQEEMLKGNDIPKKYKDTVFSLETRPIDELRQTDFIEPAEWKQEYSKEILKDIEKGKKLPTILIDKDGYILDGNHRYEAYKKAGINNIQVAVATDLTKSQLTDIWNKAQVKKPLAVKAKITPERIKPDISGISPLQKEIAAMEERIARVDVAKGALEEINTKREMLRRRITKYRDAYLKEELTGIPLIYITKEGGIKPDVAIQELRDAGIEVGDEIGLKEYLVNLEKNRQDLLAEIKAQKPEFITKKETTLLQDKIKAIEMGIREGKIQGKEEVKNVQTQLIEMIEESGLEANDRNKFMRLIKNVQTVSQLKKVMPEMIDRLQSLRDVAERRETISDLRDIFAKQPTKELPIEYKDILENIKSKVLLKKLGEKAKARIESRRQFVDRMKEEGTEINIPEEKLALLDKVSIDQMSTQELKDLKETIERLYHQGRLKDKLLTALKDRKFDSIRIEIIGIITQGKGINEDSSIVKALREQNKSLKDKTTEQIKNYIIENLRPELMLNILDGGSPGLITNTLFGSLWESQKSELLETQKVTDTIKDIHKDLNLAELFTKKSDIGRFKGMTKDMAMFIYANSFNDSNRAHLTGSGITDGDITAISNFLSAEEKKSVEDIIRFYDEYQYPILDKLFVELEGARLGKEKQYFPIDRLEDISYNKELEKDILERNYVRRPGVSKGFTKERVTSTKGFSDFSYFGTILRNYRKVEHYKAFAKSIRDVNKILNNPEIKAAIKEKMGDKYQQVLDKWLKDVAYGADKQSMDTTEKIIQWLRTNYAVAVIGGNLLSVMKAPISFIQGAEMAGKWNTTKALFKFILAPLDWNEKIAEKSVLMEFRAMRQERELGEIVSQRTKRHQIDKVTGYQLIREKSMLPWVIADKTTCDIVWLAAYEGAISDNLTEQQAINHADMVIRRTQPMSGALNLPDTFRGREYQKLFTLFRSQPNQNFNLLLESILKKQKGKIGAGEFISNQVFYLIVPAIMIGIINRKRLPEDLGEFAKDILNGAFGGLIYLGNITSMIASGFMGATTPIESVFEDLYNAYRSKDIWKKLDNLTDMISKLAGFPYLAIKRIVKGEPFGRPREAKQKGLTPI